MNCYYSAFTFECRVVSRGVTLFLDSFPSVLTLLLQVCALSVLIPRATKEREEKWRVIK